MITPTVARFEPFISEEFRSATWFVRLCTSTSAREHSFTYLNDMPYCETASYPDFQTKVTSQALVA